MTGAAFTFRSTWPVPVDASRLWELIGVLLESDDPMVWWPSVRTLAYSGDRLTVEADSRLGYRLEFSLTDLRVDRPHGLSFRGEGELDGAGRVAVTGAPTATLVIDWTATPRPGWMQGRWLRPWLRLGHRLVMRQGRRHFTAWVVRATA